MAGGGVVCSARVSSVVDVDIIPDPCVSGLLARDKRLADSSPRNSVDESLLERLGRRKDKDRAACAFIRPPRPPGLSPDACDCGYFLSQAHFEEEADGVGDRRRDRSR